MSDRVWHKGPPPHVGWWQASLLQDRCVWRWWDGDSWSKAANSIRSKEFAAVMALNKSPHQNTGILWTYYWPENARVPRLDPTGGHWTFNVDGVDPEYAGEIDLTFRDGDFVSASRGRQYWDWAIRGNGGDILAWRPAA